ncbi:MAG TPA: monothiol bacilliredoxin BrxC family protein [Vicinamibacteria bacterium]
MTLKDRVQFLTTPEQVDLFLKANPAVAIFKVGNCHKTQETFTHVQKHLEAREDLPLGIIRVLESRPASNHVESLTLIVHESPQLILFQDGKAVFDRDNWDITDEAVGDGVSRIVREAEGSSERTIRPEPVR